MTHPAIIEPMNTAYIQIFIDRLVNEGEFTQNGSLPQDILDLKGEIKSSNITYALKAYITDGHLLLNFDASCDITLPCKICNEDTKIAISLVKQTHLESLEEIKKGVYDASMCIRNAILLLIPDFAECNGNCPEREFVNKFLKKKDSQTETYQPFQGL